MDIIMKNIIKIYVELQSQDILKAILKYIIFSKIHVINLINMFFFLYSISFGHIENFFLII